MAVTQAQSTSPAGALFCYFLSGWLVGRRAPAHLLALFLPSLLLRLFTSSFMVRGPDISFLSAFPAEREILYPPITFLRPLGTVMVMSSSS